VRRADLDLFATGLHSLSVGLGMRLGEERGQVESLSLRLCRTPAIMLASPSAMKHQAPPRADEEAT
jgi:hypothetical protein